MYDKYSQATQLTAGVTKLGAHKGLLVIPNTESPTSQPGITMWAYNDQGSTFDLFMRFASHLQMGPQILPMSVYAVTGISAANVYRLN